MIWANPWTNVKGSLWQFEQIHQQNSHKSQHFESQHFDLHLNEFSKCKGQNDNCHSLSFVNVLLLTHTHKNLDRLEFALREVLMKAEPVSIWKDWINTMLWYMCAHTFHLHSKTTFLQHPWSMKRTQVTNHTSLYLALSSAKLWLFATFISDKNNLYYIKSNLKLILANIPPHNST